MTTVSLVARSMSTTLQFANFPTHRQVGDNYHRGQEQNRCNRQWQQQSTVPRKCLNESLYQAHVGRRILHYPHQQREITGCKQSEVEFQSPDFLLDSVNPRHRVSMSCLEMQAIGTPLHRRHRGLRSFDTCLTLRQPALAPAVVLGVAEAPATAPARAEIELLDVLVVGQRAGFAVHHHAPVLEDVSVTSVA